ncbi:TPA: hypothetical protein DD690_01925 [Candidatus Daviesbacteria bacterium]|uniref:Uncharacterized protein n=1 Tax=Candidatus Daviesbacteria bacterium GW2011_GWF2_38_6 TaxID=1618432 RepID=A0A0G0MWS1_9BACT|nr:MAG: hypothetical protein US80_C0003G0048 [Candidatus Daviesbacteria bacterium GW2011_GWA2_38_17]KKQ78094.1 MAG: hypothetical protein US99_C0030G0010 [Candidatus Daviesbacteria bacterium GW2011_GWF2_38_6]OGE26037.1 MAG: hypothetical protein A3D02_03335 [Candidatus Daviesbacteria bacterium RIFCSPHIGHO2_02_FULL_39_41]OGE44850.1 MAG: hypothetical protein A3E67_00370 [Candidatus Daviesbacteria bacterium RIFCSPHIGHO2_12_FULL_38_25]OGE68055.1 MAG: hypothetical protein A3H81_03605 [Candidatus Davie
MKNLPKPLFVALALTAVILTALVTYGLNSGGVKKSDIDIAVNQAKYLFEMQNQQTEDLSLGPCLSNALMPDWVADIAHNPRETIDDLPGNQCPAYLEGRARHFVELDLEGNLIRAK